MKSLSLDRPLVIIMLGMPGAGKSFFARQFSETFKAPLVNYDFLRYELFAAPQFSKEEDVVIERLALNQIEELLKSDKTFIVDGAPGTRVSRTRIMQLARKSHYNSLIIWVQTDELTARSRSAQRKSGRRFDEYNTPLTSDVFDLQTKKLSPPAPSEPYAVISGKHTYATQAKVILHKLTASRPATTPEIEPRPRLQPLAPSQRRQPNRRNITIQ